MNPKLLLNPKLLEEIGRVVGCAITDSRPLSGGCIAEVFLLKLGDGRNVVAKHCPQGGLQTEGWMLGYLHRNSPLPVPEVLHQTDTLLLMSYLRNDGGALGDAAQTHAAQLLAALHDVRGERYGLQRDTVIGGLAQPNSPSRSWIEFFRDQRLLYMGRCALDSGSLDGATFGALEALASRLDQWIGEPEAPSLIHGDMWGGNILVSQGRIAGFVDPAIYYADAEIELAFSTLFSTFGSSFFDRYAELRPIQPGFFEERRAIYNLYPLLVHTVLFGSSYAASVGATLRRLLG